MPQGMVISLGIDERKMGDRGSKSDMTNVCKRATSRRFSALPLLSCPRGDQGAGNFIFCFITASGGENANYLL